MPSLPDFEDSMSPQGLGGQPWPKMWKQHFSKAQCWGGAWALPLKLPLTIQQEPTLTPQQPANFLWRFLWRLSLDSIVGSGQKYHLVAAPMGLKPGLPLTS